MKALCAALVTGLFARVSFGAAAQAPSPPDPAVSPGGDRWRTVRRRRSPIN